MIELTLLAILFVCIGVWGKDINNIFRKIFFYLGLSLMIMNFFIIPIEYKSLYFMSYIGTVFIILMIILIIIEVITSLAKTFL